jgi:hypothetical protein
MLNYILGVIDNECGSSSRQTIQLGLRIFFSSQFDLNDIQITSDCMSRWVVLKRRVGAVTSQRVLKVFFYANILQCFFVVENFTANG